MIDWQHLNLSKDKQEMGVGIYVKNVAILKTNMFLNLMYRTPDV